MGGPGNLEQEHRRIFIKTRELEAPVESICSGAIEAKLKALRTPINEGLRERGHLSSISIRQWSQEFFLLNVLRRGRPGKNVTRECQESKRRLTLNRQPNKSYRTRG